MKAKDWKFEKYIPGAEDVDAVIKASKVYFSLPELSCRNDAEIASDAFFAGFNRGIAWQMAKLKVSQYAKVKDNFGTKDKGKEYWIGHIGLVMQVVGDYACFSQVLLKFECGTMEWFSNTTLDEVTEDGSKKLHSVEEVMESIVKEYEFIARTSKLLTSPSDGWVVLQWKFDDLWDSIRRGKLDEVCMKVESLGAQALRFVMEIGNRKEDEE